jgi:hypothetical protein
LFLDGFDRLRVETEICQELCKQYTAVKLASYSQNTKADKYTLRRFGYTARVIYTTTRYEYNPPQNVPGFLSLDAKKKWKLFVASKKVGSGNPVRHPPAELYPANRVASFYPS